VYLILVLSNELITWRWTDNPPNDIIIVDITTLYISFIFTNDRLDSPIVISKVLLIIRENISFILNIFVISVLNIKNRVAIPAIIKRESILFFIDEDKMVPKL